MLHLRWVCLVDNLKLASEHWNCSVATRCTFYIKPSSAYQTPVQWTSAALLNQVPPEKIVSWGIPKTKLPRSTGQSLLSCCSRNKKYSLLPHYTHIAYQQNSVLGSRPFHLSADLIGMKILMASRMDLLTYVVQME